MASKRTVQFEFLVEADTRQIDRFHDSLKRVQQTAPVSEGVLTSLREELTRFAAANAKTENSLQAQIAALRDASRNADLTQSEYTKLRLEVQRLQGEYSLLTNNIVGIGNAYSAAAVKAQAFTDAQIAASRRSSNLYLNNRGTLDADAQTRQQFLAGTSGATNIFPVSPNSEMGMQQRIDRLRNEARLVDATTDEYKKLKLELIQLEGQYRKLSLVEDPGAVRSRQRRQRRKALGELADTASNVAIGGFFGGPEGLLGSAVGAGVGMFGGPGAMLAGAQIGASLGLGVQQLRMQAGMVANVVTELNLAKTALAQVSNNQEQYNQKLAFARQISTDYSVGLQSTIESYARVTAAATANGLTLQETETIYRGLLASGVAFGASQADLQSIMTATVQILSKGKISAEELSGQLGERIPGAVAKFAAATGRPLAQLAKDLQDGKVSIADFVKFAEGQLDDYDRIARLIGASPEKAGERLNIALTRSAELYGTFFARLGAGFQDSITSVLNWVNENEKSIKRWIAFWALGIERTIENLKRLATVSTRVIQIVNAAANPAAAVGNLITEQVIKPQVKSKNQLNAEAIWKLYGITPEQVDQMANVLFPAGKPPQFGKNEPGTPGTLTGDDKDAKKRQAAADKAQREAEQRASEERRRQELLANNAIRLADRVFEHEMALIRKKYDYEQELAAATRAAREAGMTGAAREAQGTVNQLLAAVDKYKRVVAEASVQGRIDRRAIISAQQSAQVTAMYGAAGSSMVGGGGKLGFISANEMRAWLKSQGYERTSGDFTNKGHRTRNHMLNAIDIGELDGSHGFAVRRAKSLEALLRRTGAFGGQLFGPISDPRGHKDHVHIPTPGGRIAVTPGLAQLMRLPGAKPLPGQAAGINRGIRNDGEVDIAKANAAAGATNASIDRAQALKVLQQETIAITEQSTSRYREQTLALQDQLSEFRTRNRLQAEGVKPEIIEQQIKLGQLTRDYTRTVGTLREALGALGARTKENQETYDGITASLTRTTEAYNQNLAAQQALDKAINDKNSTFRLGDSLRSGIDEYIQSIGTLDEAVQGLTQRGFGGLSTALKELMTTGSTDFRTFAINLLSDMTEVIIQQLVVAQLAQMIRNIFGGPGGASVIGSLGSGGGFGSFAGGALGVGGSQFAFGGSPLGFANGGIMTPDGPLRLQTYSRGGIANSPQLALYGEGSTPEAYVPLPDGRRIPVAMQGGGNGSVNVNVTVDASGSNVEGDSQRSQQLGKAISDGVTAVLLREKRPGGLLYPGG